MSGLGNLQRQLLVIVGSLLMSTVAVGYAVGPAQIAINPAVPAATA